MATRAGVILWPGISQPVSCTYTMAHGASPGVAQLSYLPQDGLPAERGNLTLSDGANTVVIPDCKLDALSQSWDISSGQLLTARILDRRWKWKLGSISGVYNVPDFSGDVTRPPSNSGPVLRAPTQYIPWTVRNIHQLMELCLEAMGEPRFRILAPKVTEPLTQIHWDATTPASALSDLCNRVGCRLIYRLDDDSILIAPLGIGEALPGGSIRNTSPSIDAPERPDSIQLIGAPIEVQCRVNLFAVGREWNGQPKALNLLSYAPDPVTQDQITRVYVSGVANGEVVTVTIDGADVAYTSAAADDGAAIDGLVAILNQTHGDVVTASNVADTYVKLQSAVAGKTFEVGAAASADCVIWHVMEQPAKKPTEKWASSAPPEFMNAKATDRLTWTQARALAGESVFRWYRIVNTDVSDPAKFSADLPFVGKLKRAHQLVPMGYKLQQITPPKLDGKILDADGQPLVRNIYDGLFRQLPAACYGVYYTGTINGAMMDNRFAGRNSTPDAEVLPGFQIDAERLLVIFDEPVYRHVGYNISAAQIVLETAFQLRDEETNEILRYKQILTLPGPQADTPPAVISHDDIQLLVAATRYDSSSNGVNVRHVVAQTVDNATQTAQRADYYLAAAASKYLLTGAESRTYNGLERIWLDGAIQQVTWRIDINSGVETDAGYNNEPDLYYPSLPERAQIEYLSPRKRQIAVNDENAKAKPTFMAAAGGVRRGP